jgi:membrane fusion protein
LLPERPLFRREAVDFQHNGRQWGDVVLLQPPSSKLLAWTAVAIVAVLFVFLFFAEYARKETVTGYLTPVAGTARVFTPQPGVIETVHVGEGDLVEVGQPLLTIDTAQIAGTGEDVNAVALDTLARQQGLLEGQISAEEQRTRSETQRLSALIDGLETELEFLAEQASIHEERIALSESLVAPAAELKERGLMAVTEVSRRQEILLEQRQSLNALNQQIASRRSQLAEIRHALEQVPIETAERIQVHRRELAANEQRMAEITGRRSYVVRAPAGGLVSALYARPGQPADPRFLQMVIVPPDPQLEAELFVPTRAIGFVREGQPVRILYEAFPHQNFGAYGARTVRVSHTVVTQADVSVPVPIDEPVYRVTAALDRPDIDAYGQKVPLQAGMVLRADIILERRSLMTWLLDPLLGART